VELVASLGLALFGGRKTKPRRKRCPCLLGHLGAPLVSHSRVRGTPLVRSGLGITTWGRRRNHQFPWGASSGQHVRPTA